MKTTLYLPLTEEKAAALAVYNAQPALVIAEWTIAEIAAASVIQNMPSFAGQGQRVDKAEKAIAELISIGLQVDEATGAGAFGRLIAARFNRAAFNAGLDALSQIPARLLDQDLVNARGYLLKDGTWNFEYTAELPAILNPLTEEFVSRSGKLFKLTSQQARTYEIFKSELDESIDIQAVAGSGKSFLVERMVDVLERFNPLLLAYTQVQLNAIQERIGHGRITGMTFGALATHCLERDQTKPYRRGGKRAMRTHQLTHSVVAERLGFGPVGELQPWRVADICNRAMRRFCFSKEVTLDASHLPQIDTPLTDLDRTVLVQYAQRYWQQTTEPTDPKLDLPLRGYHRIKHLSLAEDAFLDRSFTHVIIDESHDLSWAMCAFLDRCPQPVITLGDACQRMDGHFGRRSPATRKREMVHSIRAGRQIEGVVNTLIERNPVVQVSQMEGNRDRDTKVVLYDTASIPTEPTTILCNSEWGLFEWFQRLGNAGARFSMLPTAEAAFRLFVSNCIELFNNRIRPTHNALFKYTSWASLRKDMAGDPAFVRIERMLEKGYQSTDFDASMHWLDQTGNAPIKLGRVSDARNTEVDCVMLAPDLLLNVDSGDRFGAARAFASVYTGGTRARFKLIVPGEIRDWAATMAMKAKR